MIEKIGILGVYAILLLVNLWGFKKIKRGVGHEANFHISFLIKRIGLIPTQLFSFVLVVLLIVFMPLTTFYEGMIFALFLFNLVHDYYTIVAIMEKEKNVKEKA